MGALPHLRLPSHPPPPPTPPPIDSIRDITGTEKICLKNQQLLIASGISYEMIAI